MAAAAHCWLRRVRRSVGGYRGRIRGCTGINSGHKDRRVRSNAAAASAQLGEGKRLFFIAHGVRVCNTTCNGGEERGEGAGEGSRESGRGGGGSE